MKITKYKVICKTKQGGQKSVYSKLYGTKEEALESIKRNNDISSYFVAELGDKVEIELFCDSCERDLKIGDKYIAVDHYTRFCSDCYEENSVTYYTVGGELVGDENDVRVFDEDYKEVQHD